MASINKLSVRGIRAFSPEDEEQVISFCFPLTIIVGANGCGKTTIIEALKYAVTGSLPPGNKSGQAFVHDPKNINSTQVKAAVKLRFQNRAGKSMVVVRSMELTQKKTNMTFKQLDGILRTTDEKGNKVSLSHKCSELDRQIPQLLGVSKPILEHVVFCHQEDSSWPLMEGAVLKKRFDAIFDSTRYVKALEEIKRIRKKYQSIVKDLKIELAELNGHKHASLGFRQELDECRQTQSEIHDKINGLNRQIKEEEQKCRSFNKALKQVHSIQEKIESKITHSEKVDVRISTHKEGLIDDMTKTHSKVELQQMMRGFDRQLKGDEQELEEVKTCMREIQEKIASSKERKIELSGEKGLLMGEKKLQDQRLLKRIEMMEDLATTYGLELSYTQQSQQTQREGGAAVSAGIMSTQQSNRLSLSSDVHESFGHEISMTQGSASTNSIHITAEDLFAFRQSVENKRISLEQDLENCRLSGQEADDAIQTELSELKAKITTIETELNRLGSERNKAMKEINALPRSSSRMRKSEIDEARRSAERFAKARNDLNNDPKRDSIPKQISEKESKISKLKTNIDELNGALKELRRCAEDQNNIDILEKQFIQDLELIDEIKHENGYLLHKFQIELPDIKQLECAKINNAMDTIVDHALNDFETVKMDYESANEDQKKCSDQFSKRSALLNHKQEILVRNKDKLASLSKDGRGVQQIKNVMKAVRQFEMNSNGSIGFEQNADPQQMLQYFTKKIGELSQDEPQSDNMIKVIKKLRKLAVIKEGNEAVEMRCPCCTRTFTDQAEVAVFKHRMKELADPEQSDLFNLVKNEARSNQSALNNYENWRNIISRNINDWLDYQRITNEIESLKVVVVKEQEEVSIFKSTYEKGQNKVEHLKELLSDHQQMVDLSRRLRDEIGKIANKKYQISTRKDELSLIAPSAGGKDLNTTEREMNARMEEKDTLSNEISSLNKELSMLNNTINQANISATRAEKIVREKEKQFAQEQQSITKRQELNENIAHCKSKEDKLQNQIIPIRQKANMKESEKVRLRTTSQAEIDKKSKLCTRFNTDSEKVDYITKQIDDFKNGDKLHRLENIDSEINNVNQEVIQHEDELSKMDPKLKLIQNRVDDQGAHRRNVERNLELIEIMSERDQLNDEVDLLQEQLEALAGDSIQQELNTAQNNIRKYESEKDRREGRKEILHSQQRELKRKLQTPEYENIDERHRVKMIETETSNLAVQDLDLYHSALDKALLRYHGMKIQEINKIIKELWSLTYRGEDIINIGLTSDQESSSRSTRSYNYRVVMTKGTTELDMRGRCSAGQRVLASIVIRLALAETFCLNCGVMALDEPTTNLDFANKRGLAIALAQIIAQRAAQDNFQLVIITHDEDFVAMMKNELSTHTGFNMPERYFQVSRQEGNDGCYYSKIHGIDWDEL